MRNEIPRWGWYNGMFLFEYADALETKGIQDIHNFYDSFKRKNLNGIDFPLKNQGLSISLLYMLLVVPREMWENQNNNNTSFAFTTRNLFAFREGENLDTWNFLRCMRNSISHANFNMTQEGEYTFWNTQQNGNINFNVTIMHANLLVFISEIGKYFINEIGAQQVASADG